MSNEHNMLQYHHKTLNNIYAGTTRRCEQNFPRNSSPLSYFPNDGPIVNQQVFNETYTHETRRSNMAHQPAAMATTPIPCQTSSPRQAANHTGVEIPAVASFKSAEPSKCLCRKCDWRKRGTKKTASFPIFVICSSSLLLILLMGLGRSDTDEVGDDHDNHPRIRKMAMMGGMYWIDWNCFNRAQRFDGVMNAKRRVPHQSEEIQEKDRDPSAELQKAEMVSRRHAKTYRIRRLGRVDRDGCIGLCRNRGHGGDRGHPRGQRPVGRVGGALNNDAAYRNKAVRLLAFARFIGVFLVQTGVLEPVRQ